MKKFIVTLIPNILLFVSGLITIINPYYLGYINKDKFYFDIFKFLNDFPKFRFPVAIALLLIGVIGIANIIIQYINDKNIYIIQKGKASDFGSTNFTYPKNCFSQNNTLVYTNLASIRNNEEIILDLEKENINNFYTSIDKNKNISFLSISLFPFIIYAGYCVGKSGRKVTLYHYDRVKSKSRKIRWWFKNTNEIIPDGSIVGNENNTICISISYEIDKKIVEREFKSSTIKYYKAKCIGTESIKNTKDIEVITSQIRKIISEQANEVNLLLSCSAELCFAIGQRLKSPGLPLIKVYNFSAKDKSNKWNWSIYLK